MKKIILIIFFLLIAGPVHADTGYLWPSTGTTDGSSYANTQSQDSNYNSWGSVTSEYLIGYFPENDYLPENVVIDAFLFQFRIRTPTPSGGWSWFPQWSINDGGTFTAGAACGLGNETLGGKPCQYNTTTSFALADMSVDNDGAHKVTPAEVNSGHFQFKIFQSTGTKTTDIDYWRVGFMWHDAEAGITSSTASVSGQIVWLNLQGDTATSSATMDCRIDILERCTRSGYAGWTSQTSVAKIKLSPSYTAPTRNLGGGVFTGYGWGNPTTDSTWQADNVEVPYNAGYSCDYPMAQICYDRNTNEVISYKNYSTDPQFVATPSAGLTSTTFTEPEPTNPLSWIVWKIQQIFWGIFGVHEDFNYQVYEELKSNFESKAPFAYAVALFDMDLSAPTVATAAPTITLSFVHTLAPSFPDSVAVSAPTELVTLLSYTRPVLTMLLWLLFIAYLFFVPRRLFV